MSGPGALALCCQRDPALHSVGSPAGSAGLPLLGAFQLLVCPDLTGADDHALKLLPRYISRQSLEMRSLVLRGLITLSERPETVSSGQAGKVVLAAWGRPGALDLQGIHWELWELLPASSKAPFPWPESFLPGPWLCCTRRKVPGPAWKSSHCWCVLALPGRDPSPAPSKSAPNSPCRGSAVPRGMVLLREGRQATSQAEASAARCLWVPRQQCSAPKRLQSAQGHLRELCLAQAVGAAEPWPCTRSPQRKGTCLSRDCLLPWELSPPRGLQQFLCQLVGSRGEAGV